MEKQEFRLIDKYGEITYKWGTLYEAADYALRHQLLIDREEEDNDAAVADGYEDVDFHNDEGDK